ncbi:NADPH-adrenodoxin reductase, partial [Coemansia sp. RSA 485]
FTGPIRLKNAEVEFLVLEDYGETENPLPNEEPKMLWFGRVVGRGSRELIDKFDVKKRKYLGNTTMDAELSLVMANQALARPGILVYDPFVGTGSFLLTCSHFGACSMGSDIDGRQIRGTAGFRRNVNGIKANLAQYNLESRVLDTTVFDVCRNPWRSGALFDAIVTDPPYGVRAGAKRLGRRNGTVPENSFRVVDGIPNHRRDDYYPPTVPYEMSDVVEDLLALAAEKLVVGGRLVYWLPTVAGEYQPEDVPGHPVLRLVANSEQPFGGWSRRLITMEKVKELDTEVVTVGGGHEPAHKNFRDRYFAGFEPAITRPTAATSLDLRISAIPVPRYFTTTTTTHGTNRTIAVVGGGAAGFYTASRILAKTNNVFVDIFERLPAPHGLVRYGVAPDHPEVKNCTNKFDSVASDPRVRLFANVSVGDTIPLDRLRNAYDGVVLAYGASKDRRLNIPGEDGSGDGEKQGVVSARRFVAWYNGYPEAQGLTPDLESFDRVVIVGHGNVALDCARILLSDPDVLAKTDITEAALRVLRKSRVRHVEMVGRRGPLQVSFTTKELREMTKIPGLQIICDRELLNTQCDLGSEYLESRRPLKRMMELLLKHAVDKNDYIGDMGEKTFTLRFLMSPQEMLFDQKVDGQQVPQLLRFGVNRLEGMPESAKAISTDEIIDVPCSVALRSIGYKSTRITGAPFDDYRGVVPNIAGRVTVDQDLVPGLYVAGWLKRGPVGVIATTMQDAYRTADAVVMDLNSGVIGHNDLSFGDADRVILEDIKNVCITNEEWKRLEKYEVEAGRELGKPREKVTEVGQMLAIARGQELE